MIAPVVRSVAPRQLDLKAFTERSALESDYGELITAPTVITDPTQGDRPVIVYLELSDDPAAVVAALQQIDYRLDFRTNGMMTRSRTFGYAPRNTVRRDYCSTASLANEDAEAHAVLMEYADKVSRYYLQFNAELYQRHAQMTDQVLPEYKIGSSVFTSGIVNKNNPLKYHFDKGNFKDVWSNMLVFKHKVQGGHLSVPEFDLGFELKDNSLLMFDGQNLLHGVTPIKMYAPDSHRYSVVYYALREMWKCEPLEDELTRFRRLRTERERRRR